MKVTKYEHAYLEIELEGKRLLIDPGVYSKTLGNHSDVSAVVITHVHADHLDERKLLTIRKTNPDAVFYSTQEVADQLKDRLAVQVVTAQEQVTVGPFELEFFGKDHTVLTAESPIFQNIGVMVNSKFYYPGDSFTLPNKPVELLAAPAGSPWAKISEEFDFITAVKPRAVFPTHNAHLSEIGMQGRNNWLKQAADSVGSTYTVLEPGSSLSV